MWVPTYVLECVCVSMCTHMCCASARMWSCSSHMEDRRCPFRSWGLTQAISFYSELSLLGLCFYFDILFFKFILKLYLIANCHIFFLIFFSCSIFYYKKKYDILNVICLRTIVLILEFKYLYMCVCTYIHYTLTYMHVH